MSTTNNCTLTLGGQCYTKLDDIVTFITKLKDLNLSEQNKCCMDGSQVGTNCKCPEEKDDMSKVCLWDTCLTFPDLQGMIAKMQSLWKTNTPAPIAWIGVLWAYIGTGNPIPDSLPIFLSNTGGLVGVVSGVLGASWAGIKIAQGAIQNGYFNGDQGKNFFFYQYGGNSWEGNAIGLVEALWTVAFLLETAALAYGPFEIMYSMDKQWRKADTATRDKLGFHYMTMGLIEAIGVWGASMMLGGAAEGLLGFYDLKTTDGETKYKQLFGETAEFTNGNATLVDIIQHSVLTFGYVLMATAASAGTYWYVYSQVVPGQEGLPNPL